jgi:two-component system, OmpR family, response regulator MtrA
VIQSVNTLQSIFFDKSGIISQRKKIMPTKILVIDDDIAITELMSMLLKTHGFDVITTNSGVEGVKLVREKNPNVVLLDLMMPDMDGWQVSKAIRAFNNVPILILSAINDPAMVASVLDTGADDFLVKPVPSSVLVAHIRKMVRRNTGSLNSLNLRKNDTLVSQPLSS